MDDASPQTPASIPGHDTLELFAFLACMGPDAFDPERAPRLVCPHGYDLARMAAIARMTDPEARDAVSREVATVLAEVLARRARVSSLDLGEILPAFLEADLAHGFDVIRELAVSASPTLAAPLGDILLNLAVSARADATLRSTLDARQDRLVDALAALPLASSERTRLFLALSQTLQRPESIARVIASTLFPSRPDDALYVLAEGNDAALQTLLQGTLVRNGGRDDFKALCRRALEIEDGLGFGLLARLDRLLHSPEAGLRYLESTVRAAVLECVERNLDRGPALAEWLPNEPDARTLRLLSLVAPGLPQPGRTHLCTWVLDRAADRMEATDRQHAPSESLVEAIVGAATMHEDPPAAGAQVRGALLKAATTLRVRVLAVGTPSPEDLERARAFERFAGLLGTEFRRRRPLVGVLEGILPHVTDLSRVPDEDEPIAWADDHATAS